MKIVRLLAINLGLLLALTLALKFLPNSTLWLVTIALSFVAYRMCTRAGWLVFVFVPFFPFSVFFIELDSGYHEKSSFGITIAAWAVFALAAIVGAWRWWKRMRNSEPRTD